MTISIHTVKDLDLVIRNEPWAFARDNSERIEAHFADLRTRTPQLFNGRILLARNARVDDDRFHADYFETNFASFIAWRDWGHPGEAIVNAFGMGALRSADGAFILGEMGAHTANAGKVYFPAGTPDRSDIVGDRMDIAGSIAREVEEEVGIRVSDYVAATNWSIVFDGPRVAVMRVLQSHHDADALNRAIAATLAGQKEPELAAIHLVRGMDDLTPAMPPYIHAYLRRTFG
jgi:8-oxo-dGTP pyrophosphatase MutT (NUDIX family)